MNIEISKETLDEISKYNRTLTDENEQDQPFEFWNVVGLLDASDDILAAAEKAGYVRPPVEEDYEEEEKE